MSALRAMLQLRSNSQPSTLPSHTNQQQLHQDTADTESYFSNSSTSNTTNNLGIHLQQSAGQASSVHSVSTASFHGQPSAATSPATANGSSQKQATPAKKPVPFQNLGLHSGAASGNLGLVKFALDNGQPIDSVLNGVFAIHAACCSNANVAVVLFLIERGADVNARRLPRKYSNEKGVQTVGTTGSTPLHFAAANGCLSVVDILLRHGAIVDMTDKYGSSPLSVAAARNHPDVASLLRQYSAMQRGVQDLTPDAEAKDPFADRRGSSDFHRGAAIVTPPTRPAPVVTPGHQKETSSQSLPLPTARSSQTARSPGQRRISLPSIIESPSSPNVAAPPRQSCDFGRTPQSTEPLVRGTASIRSTPSQPTRNIMMSPTKPEDRPVKALARDPSASTPETKAARRPTSTTMRRSHTTQGAQQSTFLAAPESTAMKRRKSMESVGFLSPQAALAVHRRKSFDQLTSLTRSNSKSRRSSDASTASQGTASSGTSGTSRTSMSDSGSDPTHAGGGTTARGTSSGSKTKQVLSITTKPIDSGNASTLPSPLTRSMSQPVLEFVKPRRTPVSFAMDTTASVARQSLDLQRLASNLDRVVDKDRHVNMEPRNDSESDLPGLLFRRRTMQDSSNSKVSPPGYIPRYGIAMIETLAESTISEERPHQQQQQHSNGSTTSLQDMSIAGAGESGPAAPRHSTSSISSGHSIGSSGAAFSGNATVSGRISRIWSSSNASSKESLNLNSGELGELMVSGGEGAAGGGLARPDHNRSRASMLNRLSGIWSRR